jgi:hypothetical protein
MNRSSRGFVLLVVLCAAAVLSLVAAFIYSRTENQLMMSIASRGQSIAASRATLAAERKLAIYRVNYPPALGTLAPSLNYAAAVAAAQVADLEFWNYDKGNYPTMEVSNGGGAQWCTQSWLLDRGVGVPPWTVVEAFGFYGYTAAPPGDFVNCNPQGNAAIVSSRITLYLETPATGGSGPGGGGPAAGTGAVGGS